MRLLSFIVFLMFCSAVKAVAPLEDIRHEISIQEKYRETLMNLPGVVGMGIGLRDGEAVIVLLVHETIESELIPRELDGISVVVDTHLPSRFLNGGTGCSVFPEGCHDDEFPLPVPMGVSTSNVNQCDAGTLGFKACDMDSGEVGYVTANHVAAAVPGPDFCENAPPGALQVQPGRFDIPSCNLQNNIGVLANRVTIVQQPGFNRVDAAFVQSDDTQTTREILDIGLPSEEKGVPSLDLCVKKSGRTTGLTFGRIDMVNVSFVEANDPCYPKGLEFRDLIRVTPDTSCGRCSDGGCPVVDGGDSGSAVLDLQDRIVGLAFYEAGLGRALAATIDNIMLELNVDVDLTSCKPLQQIFNSGFESGDTSEWSDTVGPRR